MDMGRHMPVAVAFVVAEIGSLAAVAHMQVALVNWSHSLGETSTRRL